MREIITAITGASGAIYAYRFLQKISKISDITVHLIVSPAAKIVFEEELGIKIKDGKDIFDFLRLNPNNFKGYKYDEINAKIASGSYPVDSMVVIPSSMGTIAAIAHGLSTNLIERAADVTLKEKRKLILVPRETPWHTIHFENCLKLSQIGAIILPANPSFYSKPKNIEELVDTIVLKVIQHLGFSDLFEEYNKFIYKNYTN